MNRMYKFSLMFFVFLSLAAQAAGRPDLVMSEVAKKLQKLESAPPAIADKDMAAIAKVILIAEGEINRLKSENKINPDDAQIFTRAIGDLKRGSYIRGYCLDGNSFGCVYNIKKVAVDVPIHLNEPWFNLNGTMLELYRNLAKNGTPGYKEKLENLEKETALLQFGILIHEWKHKQFTGLLDFGRPEEEAYGIQSVYHKAVDNWDWKDENGNSSELTVAAKEFLKKSNCPDTLGLSKRVISAKAGETIQVSAAAEDVELSYMLGSSLESLTMVPDTINQAKVVLGKKPGFAVIEFTSRACPSVKESIVIEVTPVLQPGDDMRQLICNNFMVALNRDVAEKSVKNSTSYKMNYTSGYSLIQEKGCCQGSHEMWTIDDRTGEWYVALYYGSPEAQLCLSLDSILSEYQKKYPDLNWEPKSFR